MNIFLEIYNFFNHPFFIIFGGITAILAVFSVLMNFVCWILGIAPLLWRFGYGRWFRKIEIVADDEHYNILKGDLVSSGIFRKKNISQILATSLAKVRGSYLTLVHYQSFTKEQIKTILADKMSNAGMIIYFPEYSPGSNEIPAEMMKIIHDKENTTLVNFRGRLLNDIITTLITTSYEKR